MILDYPYHIGLTIRKSVFVEFSARFSEDVFSDTEFVSSDSETMFIVWCGLDICKPIYDAVIVHLNAVDYYMCAVGYTDERTMLFSATDQRGNPALNPFGCFVGICYEKAKDSLEGEQ